jgi:hypothetical protein
LAPSRSEATVLVVFLADAPRFLAALCVEEGRWAFHCGRFWVSMCPVEQPLLRYLEHKMAADDFERHALPAVTRLLGV